MRPDRPQTTEIPQHLAEGPAGPLYAWLAENGITEWLPEAATIVIDASVRSITYPSYSWTDDQRGFNPEYLAGPEHGQAGEPIVARIVRLEVPLTDEARQSARDVEAAGLGRMKFIEL